MQPSTNKEETLHFTSESETDESVTKDKVFAPAGIQTMQGTPLQYAMASHQVIGIKQTVIDIWVQFLKHNLIW